MPRPVSLQYPPAPVKIDYSTFSFVGYPGDPASDRYWLALYRVGEFSPVLEVVFTGVRRLVLESEQRYAPVVCPACLAHRRAIVLMAHIDTTTSECLECGGILSDTLHGEGATVLCLCGKMPHEETCPMSARRLSQWTR